MSEIGTVPCLQYQTNCCLFSASVQCWNDLTARTPHAHTMTWNTGERGAGLNPSRGEAIALSLNFPHPTALQSTYSMHTHVHTIIIIKSEVEMMAEGTGRVRRW